MNSRLPKRSIFPGWRGCWRLSIWSLTGSCSSTRSRPLPGAPTVGVSTRGVPGPTSKLSLRVPAQMGRRETEHKGGNNKGNRGLVLSSAQGGCACSRGLQAFAWERERALFVSPSSHAATFSFEGPGPSFYRCKEKAQVYNGGCSNVLTCLAEGSQSPMYMPTWLSERFWCPVHVMSWPSEERLSPVGAQLSGLSDPC
jgi:hypothetical protein